MAEKTAKPSGENSSENLEKFSEFRLMNQKARDELRKSFDDNNDGVVKEDEYTITEEDAKTIETLKSSLKERKNILLEKVTQKTEIDDALDKLSDHRDYETLSESIDEIEMDIIKAILEHEKSKDGDRDQDKIKIINEYLKQQLEGDLSETKEKSNDSEKVEISKKELVKSLDSEDEITEKMKVALEFHGKQIVLESDILKGKKVSDMTFNLNSGVEDIVANLGGAIGGDDVKIAKGYLKILAEGKKGNHHLVNRGSEIAFMTEAELKTEKVATEKLVNGETLDFAKGLGLGKLADKRKAFRETVKDKTTGGNASLFGRILNFLFGSLIGPLSESNSVLGRIFRKVADIPDPAENLSPISPALKETALSENSLSPILAKLKAINFQSTTAKNKKSNLTDVLKDGFGVNEGNLTSSKKKLKKTTQHSVKITPTGKDQFAQIYSFFKSDPGVVASKTVLADKISSASQMLPDGIGNGALGGLEAVTNKLGVNVEGGANALFDMFAPESENIESSNTAFSEAKQKMDSTGNLFVGLGVEALSTGHILITWSDENEKPKPVAKKTVAAVKQKPQPQPKPGTTDTTAKA